MKTFFRIRYLLITAVFLLLFFSCQDDETLTENSNETVVAIDATAKHITFDDFKNQNKPISNFVIERFTQQGAIESTIQSSNYGFSINTAKIQVISGSHYTSYTFIVNREETVPNILENYILITFDDGSYTQMLAQYPFVAQNGDIHIQMQGATATNISDESLLATETLSPCPNTTQEIIEWSDNVNCIAVHCGEGGNHPPGQQCEDGIVRSYWQCEGGWVVTGCLEFSGGSTGSGWGSPSGGGNNPINNEDEEIPVIPLSLTPLEEVTECMNPANSLEGVVNLTPEMITYLQNNRNLTLEVNDYLQSENCSDTAKDIAVIGIETFMNNGEAKFEDLVFKHESFKGSNLDCIHKKLMSTSNLYSRMISKFYNNSGTIITYDIGQVAAGDWGNTKASYDNYGEMIITFSQDVENHSNLSKKVTLSHEMIHAYMFHTLEEWGFITIDLNGDSRLNINCPEGINYDNINLNTLSIKARFVAIICAFNQAGTLTTNWTHELFGLWHYDTNTYVDNLKIFLLQNHDWDNENADFKSEAIAVFGELSWKEEVAKATSWIGLEGTTEYLEYAESYISEPFKFAYITDIKIKLQNAKSDCP